MTDKAFDACAFVREHDKLTVLKHSTVAFAVASGLVEKAYQAGMQAAWNRRAPEVPEGWREFVSEVAQQTPEKPDYWSSCGQCERNADKAQDLIAAAPQPPKDTE